MSEPRHEPRATRHAPRDSVLSRPQAVSKRSPELAEGGARDEPQSSKALSVPLSPLLLVFLLALALRLLVWRWHEQYPLGGDEQEYFNQALTLLREHRYAELNLMRPPLYTGWLAGCIIVFDSLVQRIRLVQAIISALTVVPIFLLARQLFPRPKIALLAATLAALDFTLAASATELLTETLFVFGLATVFWLLAVGARRRSARWLGAAGLALGALILLRSVALPLVPLGALWLLLQPTTDDRQPTTKEHRHERLLPWSVVSGRWSGALVFLLAAALVVAPWTLRNALAYHALIVVDTTGAENLWLDNNPAAATPADPLGREDAKRALYALGDDRAARQRLASANGLAAIAGNPGWFLAKAWGEAQKFFALQFFDDMRARRAIWLPPAEVWLRVLLGDGMWLVLLLGGAAGLWLARRQETGDGRQKSNHGVLTSAQRVSKRSPEPAEGGAARKRARGFAWQFSDARWVFVPWALYTLFTAMLFHTELRYRLPLYPVLLPYAAWALAQIVVWRRQIRERKWAMLGAALTIAALLGMTLLHRPYLAESVMLARKHWQLAQAGRALDAGDAAAAQAAAGAALALDPDSALARVALARAALAQNDRAGAETQLDAAIAALRAQPYAHLLRGALMREAGDRPGAAAEFAYETSSRDDLQRWSWQAFDSFQTIPASVQIGDADLGLIQGFWPPEDGARWTHDTAQIRLAGAGTQLVLELNANRPAGAPLPQVQVSVNGQVAARLAPTNGWARYTVVLPAAANGPLLVALQSDTFRPRAYNRASPDDRDLGVLVRSVAVTP